MDLQLQCGNKSKNEKLAQIKHSKNGITPYTCKCYWKMLNDIVKIDQCFGIESCMK